MTVKEDGYTVIGTGEDFKPEKKEPSPMMKHIEHLIWKNYQYEVNNRQIILSHSDHAYFVTLPITSTLKAIDAVEAKIKKLINDTKIAVYKFDRNTFIIGSIATPEEAYKYHETIVVKEGEKIIEAQKKVLELKEQWSKSLAALVQAKKDLPVATETIEFIKNINLLS